MGLPYWSFSACLKHEVKNAVEYISHYEDAVAAKPAARGVDGVVCGHIHHAEIRMIGGSSISMTETGLKAAPPLSKMPADKMEILRWAIAPQTIPLPQPPLRPGAPTLIPA